jgi:hypothetical protein
MSNYALDTPIKRNVYVPDSDVPFAPVYVSPNPPELDQSHRSMTWQFDKRQQIVGTLEQPKSARLDKKK